MRVKQAWLLAALVVAGCSNTERMTRSECAAEASKVCADVCAEVSNDVWSEAIRQAAEAVDASR